MPYIKIEDRQNFNSLLEQNIKIKNPGELNFLITKICKKYLDNKENNYQTFNDIVGALECCKIEFYRRKIASYEDFKIKENGDVF